MGFSSTNWAHIISLVASRFFFFLILIQLPLFRFPCRIGMCQSPVEVTVCQLIAVEIFPEVMVKTLLYPEAIKKAMMRGTTIPSHDQLLYSFKSKMKKAPATTDLKHLEVIAGSYLCVTGALLGLIKRGRMSLFGLTLIVWGISKEIFIGKNVTRHPNEALCIYPEMAFAMVFAFCSIRCDVRKLIKSCKSKQIAKRLKIYSKAKYR